MLVVVGGHSRNVGKTSVVCGIIRALREWHWTAIKITQYGHGVCSHAGEPCECADPIHPVAISEENGRDPRRSDRLPDSGRFLASGAERAFWVRTAAGQLNEAMPRLRRIMAENVNVIVESNSILRFVKPDFCAMTLDPSVADFKPTSLRFLDRADALVFTSDATPAWPNVSPRLLMNKTRFAALAPRYENPALAECIANRFTRPTSSCLGDKSFVNSKRG